MRRKQVKAEPSLDRSHLVTDTGGAGTLVRIKPGNREHVEPGVYRVVEHVLNTNTGSEWVQVYGGPKGYSMHRFVRPGDLRPATKREAARAA